MNRNIAFLRITRNKDRVEKILNRWEALSVFVLIMFLIKIIVVDHRKNDFAEFKLEIERPREISLSYVVD